MRGISSSVPFFEASGTQLVEISEILFGHTDYQGLTRGELSISINRTLRNIRKSVFGLEKLRRVSLPCS